LQRAGSVSAVTNDALFPNVVDRFDEEALAVTAFTVTQAIGARLSVFGGLMNTAEGDANELAGSALANDSFLNSALLYSLVEDATVPNVSLGGGIACAPHERVSGSLAVFGTSETAGESPFEPHGTTFATEWTVHHTLADRGGAETFGALYGMDARRADIAADPRTVLTDVLAGRPAPTTSADTWALYVNAHQFLHGDGDGGVGLFLRAGLSDGDPNPVRWNAAGGVAGVGPLRGRPHDRWGLGMFALGISDADLLRGLGVGTEIGGELFYAIAATPWLMITLDAQVIDSALPRPDTAGVLGVRTHVTF
jgi:porin